MNPTIQQSTFIDALVSTTRNLCLRARAGCGKTTTILLGFVAYAKAFPSHVVHVCAYNKPIADEVSAKLKAQGFTDWQKYNASTVHSMGNALVKFAFQNPKIDDKKVYNLVQARIDSCSPQSQTYQYFFKQIIQLVSYAKQAGVGFFDDSPIGDPSTWHKLADHFDVNGFDDTSVMDQVVSCSQEIYRASLDQTDVIDFDDMILFPLTKNLKVKFTKDLILVDEYQDISRARQALIRKFLRPGSGRISAIGDDMQAIFGFSGADSTALDTFIAQHDALVLPLSVTWRCPKKVVELAQKIVPDLEAAESAKEGTVRRQVGMTSKSEVPEESRIDSKRYVYIEDLIPGKDQDVILCRNTAPLIDIAYKLIRAQIPCKVEGRKIGEGLINLVKKWKLSTTSRLANKLEDYRDREMQKAMAKGNESKAAEVDDRVTTILHVITAVNVQGKNHVSDVVEFIENLFADGADRVVTLATYHRSKGREWNRVILWEHSQRCPSRAARQQWAKDQERNLAYVAITRAKDTLVFVD